MLRNVCIVVVLAALAATSAVASSAVPGKAARLAHHKAVQSSARAARKGAVRASGRMQSGRTGSSRVAKSRAVGNRGIRPRSRVAANSQRIRVLHSTGRTPQLRRTALVRRRIYLPASPLKGSLESLTRQNERMEADGLERILDEQDLSDRIEQKLLVPLPISSSLIVNSDLVETHRYCRPWTANFLSDLAEEHETQFHKAFIVSSAVRTVEYQQHLMRRNHNAAAAEGDVVSPHLTGGTIDIAKSGMSRKEIVWMRNRLLAMQTEGKIDVEEEFRQPCFHITVYKNYGTPELAPGTNPDPAAGTQTATGAPN
jgi:Family of unknown function (DUF5715)